MRILSIVVSAVVTLFDRVTAAPATATRNCDEYGEELAWLGGDMDGQELHEPVMRLDGVRRHPEATATFPEGDVA